MARSTKPNQKYKLNPNQIVAPVVPVVLDKLLQYVTVPHMYDNKGYSLNLTQAIKTLESKHLRANPVRLSLKDANPRFKDFRDQQVIGSRPKQGCPVPIGSSVTIKYITQDVIDESLRLFYESKNVRRIEDQQTITDRIRKVGVKIKHNVVQAFPHKSSDKNDCAKSIDILGENKK